jgi:hypothetical protein
MPNKWGHIKGEKNLWMIIWKKRTEKNESSWISSSPNQISKFLTRIENSEN